MSKPPQKPQKPPTIIDVARRAGVSKSTVSNVLQGKVRVDETTRERVLSTIDELGYLPNAGARYLRQRSHVLGIVVGDLRNPFHAEMAALIEEHAAARRHSILLATTGGLEHREVARVQTLIEHRVAAVIFVALSGSGAGLAAVGPGVPRILVSFTKRGDPSIAVDDRAGAGLAVDHLAALGHRNIAYISTMLADEPRTDAARFAGFRRALERHGLESDSSAVLRPDSRSNRAHLTIREELEAFLVRTRRPTGIVAANDFMALEIIEAADAIGLEIPRDLSVVGFDDISIAGLSRIQLTTIAQPMSELAERSVIAAIDGGQHPESETRKSVKLAPELVVRNSTAPPRGR